MDGSVSGGEFISSLKYIRGHWEVGSINWGWFRSSLPLFPQERSAQLAKQRQQLFLPVGREFGERGADPLVMRTRQLGEMRLARRGQRGDRRAAVPGIGARDD